MGNINKYTFASELSRMRILILFSVLVIFLTRPYLGYVFLPNTYCILAAAITIFVLIFSFKYAEFDRNDRIFILVWLLWAMSTIIFAYVQTYLLENASLLELRKAIGKSFKVLYVIAVIILIKKNYSFFLKCLYGINFIILFFSVILFFLLLSGYHVNHWRTPIRESIHLFYLNDGFFIGASNIVKQLSHGVFIRISGFSDEPGALALIIINLIILNEFTYKSKAINFILLAAGIFTFSIAFVISIILIYLYWLIASKKKIVFVLTSGLLIIALISFYQFFANQKVQNAVDAFFISRFQADDTTFSIKGEGRIRSLYEGHSINAFMDNPFWGLGTEKAIRMKATITNIVTELAMYGLFGFFLFYLPFYYLVLKNIKRIEVLLLVILFINFLQRPGIYELFPMVIITLLNYSHLFEKKTTTIQRESG